MIIISIIIPARNRISVTEKVLSQLNQQIQITENSKNIFVIVVDDGSTDGTSQMVESNFTKFYLIQGDGSLWWTGAINKGMEYAILHFDPDFFVWLNDDLILSDNFIYNLVINCNKFKDNPIILGGIVKDFIYENWIVYSGYYQGKPVRNFDLFELNNSPKLEVEVLSGNIVVIPQEIVNKIGLPNPKILPHHGGDYEYVKRAIKYGFKAFLSCDIEAKTHFYASDVIRYMPYWMQWYIQPSFLKRLEIIQGLTSLKANQNIGVYIQLSKINKNSKTTYFWEYIFCYICKLVKLLIINFIPSKYIDSKINHYINEQKIPDKIANEIVNKRQK